MVLRSGVEVLVHDTVIVSAASYPEAQEAVGFLRSSGMSRESLAIVGAELVLTERPRSSTAGLAAKSAGTGLGLGLLAAVFVTLVADTNLSGLAVVLWGIVYGVLVGGLIGLGRGLVHNRPEAVFTELLPARYEVRATAADASVARALLDQQNPLSKAA
jgi:hypothetical protein